MSLRERAEQAWNVMQRQRIRPQVMDIRGNFIAGYIAGAEAERERMENELAEAVRLLYAVLDTGASFKAVMLDRSLWAPIDLFLSRHPRLAHIEEEAQ